ncbi:MAG: class C sortase [Clostridia bacterium]
MGEVFQNFIVFMIFALGVVLVSYPTISNWYNEKTSSYVVGQYDETVGNKQQEEYLKMFEQAREFNELLKITNRFLDATFNEELYEDSLDVIGGMMGYLEIDTINIRLPIYHGTSDGVLQKAVGHLEGSYLPTGDLGNSTVLTGHTGLPSADLLTGLSAVEIGDTFNLKVLDKVYVYEVFEINVVEPYEVDKLNPIEDIDMVTLVTCTPYGVNSHRLLVHGKQITVEEEFEESFDTEEQTQQQFNVVKLIPIIVIPLLILLIMILILCRVVYVYYVFKDNGRYSIYYEMMFRGKITLLWVRQMERK